MGINFNAPPTVNPNPDAPDQSQLPAQGAAPGAPTAPGIPSPGGIAGDPLHSMAAAYMQHLLVNQPKPAGNTVAADTQRAKDALEQSKNPQPQGGDQHAPGSFASKLANASEGIMGALGDAAHARDTKGGGWLSGVVNTLAARNARLAQQSRDQELHAKNQVETLALNRSIWRQDQEIRQQGIATNKDIFDGRKANYDVHEDVDQDTAMKLASDPQWLQSHNMAITGERPQLDNKGEVTKDKRGNPVMLPTFSWSNKVSKSGETTDNKLSAQESGDMGKYLGQSMPAGTKLTDDQYTSIRTKIATAQHVNAILEQSNGKALTADQMKGVAPYLSDPSVMQAVGEVPGNAYAGIQTHLTNADQHLAALEQQKQAALAQGNQAAADKAEADKAPFQAEKAKLKSFASVAISEKQVDDYEKKAGNANTSLIDLQKKANAAHGEEAAAMAASTQHMLESGDYTDEQKKVLKHIHDQTQDAANASHDWEVRKEVDKARETNALNEEDIPTLVEGALNYTLDPNKIYTMRKDQNAKFKAELLRTAKERGIEWSDSDYAERRKLKMGLADLSTKALGGQIQNLNQFAYHTGAANKSIQGLNNLSAPLLNKPINSIKAGMTGFEEAATFKIDAEASKNEFLTIINNGYVPPTEEETRLAAQIDWSHTPAELQSTFRGMAHLVAARGRAMNQTWERSFHQPIPDFLNADTQNIMRQFGINPDEITASQNKETSMSQNINPSRQPNAGNLPVAKDDPSKRPTGTMGIVQGSDNKWYYHDKNHKILGPAPDQQ